MHDKIMEEARKAMTELMERGNFKAGNIVVVGCSSSEIMGENIGKGSTPEAAQAVVEGIMPVVEAHGGLLAAQCCEHLNRALVVERATAEKFGYDVVCVRPRPKAGGSLPRPSMIISPIPLLWSMYALRQASISETPSSACI